MRSSQFVITGPSRMDQGNGGSRGACGYNRDRSSSSGHGGHSFYDRGGYGRSGSDWGGRGGRGGFDRGRGRGRGGGGGGPAFSMNPPRDIFEDIKASSDPHRGLWFLIIWFSYGNDREHFILKLLCIFWRFEYRMGKLPYNERKNLKFIPF
jgi:hypothetical protein